MRTLALWVIAVCYAANTVSIYDTDDGGTSIFFGNIGYYSEMED